MDMNDKMSMLEKVRVNDRLTCRCTIQELSDFVLALQMPQHQDLCAISYEEWRNEQDDNIKMKTGELQNTISPEKIWWEQHRAEREAYIQERRKSSGLII